MKIVESLYFLFVFFNKNMKSIIDEIRHTIQIVFENSEYDNKVFIKGS